MSDLLRPGSIGRLFASVLLGCLLLFAAPLMAANNGDNLLGELGLSPAKPRFLPPAEAFVVKATQQQNKVQVAVSLAPGYYLYKDKFRFTLSSGRLGNPDWPTAATHDDEFFGQSQVYFDGLLLDLPLLEVPQGATLTISYQGCTEGMCYPPNQISLPLNAVVTTATTPPAIPEANSSESIRQQLDNATGTGRLVTLGLFLLFGLGLAFTPCMLPMYPILGSVVLGNQSVSGKRAVWLAFCYVQGMALCYTLLGLLVASLGAGLQAWLQQPALLLTFSLFFVLLAANMFGLLHVRLPQGWQQALHRISGAQRGGSATGCFGMGLVAALICSPCTTAPLTGALLYVAQSGDRLLGGLALYLLAMGMGLPLLLLALFGRHCLPRSGLWMERVKRLFGFILLFVPLLLLGRILPEFWLKLGYLLLGAVTLGYLALTLLPGPRSRLAAMVAILLLGNSLWHYWPGLTGDSLPFTPLRTPEALQQQLQEAKAANQGVVVDFYADWCVACKQLERETFSDPLVRQRLSGYRLLRVDVTVATEPERQLMEQLKVPGLPALLIFPSGADAPTARIDGFLPPSLFVQALPTCHPEQPC